MSALLAHQDKATVNPLDVGQWEFYVVPTAQLEARIARQHSMQLSTLRKSAPPATFDGLANAARAAAAQAW